MLNGDAFMLKSANAAPDVSEHWLWLDTAAQEMSWGIYAFSGVNAADGPFGLLVELASTLPTDYYLGVADYALESWRWLHITAPTNGDFVSVPEEWLPVSGSGVVHAAVVTWDGQAAAVARVTLYLNLTAPPPAGLSASDGTSGRSIELSWTDPADSFPGLSYDAIQLERAESAAGPFSVVDTLPPGTTTYSDVHDGVSVILPYNAFVYYRASTVVDGTPGPVGALETGYRVLADVAGFDATDDLPDRIELTWQAVSGAADYLIEYHAFGGGEPAAWTPLTAPAVTAFTHTPADPPGGYCEEQVTYEYRIKARYLGDLSVDFNETHGLRDGPPVAALSADPQFSYPAQVVTLSAAGSSDTGGGDIVGYRWDLDGDETYEYDSGTDDYVLHTFDTLGFHQAGVEITDDEGDTATAVVAIAQPGAVHTFGSAGRDEITAVACDDQNRIYSAGTYKTATNQYMLVGHYNQGGQMFWCSARDVDGSGQIWLDDVAVDNQDHAYFVGGLDQTATGRDALLVQWNANGTPGWARTLSTTNDEYFKEVGCDELGNIYAVGSVHDGTHDSLLAVKYSPAGNLEWAKTWSSGATGRDFGDCLAVGSGTQPQIFLGGYTEALSDDGACMLLSVTSGGILNATTSYSLAPQHVTISDLAFDEANGWLYCAGAVMGDAVTPDTLLLRWNEIDGFAWQKVWIGSVAKEERAKNVVLGADGIWLVGSTLSYDPGTIDALVLRYDDTGNLVSQDVYDPDTTAEVYFCACAAADGGLVLAGGAPDITGTWHDFFGSVYDASGTEAAVSGTWSDFTADQIESGLSTVPYDLVEDAGGGGLDMLLMKLGPLM